MSINSLPQRQTTTQETDFPFFPNMIFKKYFNIYLSTDLSFFSNVVS